MHKAQPQGDGWIQTYTGKRVWPMEMRGEDLSIRDIAHALSLICRYGGHCPVFYSVAQHCVLAAQWSLLISPPVLPQVALLHDASEAYLADIPGPVKHQLREYMVNERTLEEMIYQKYLPKWSQLCDHPKAVYEPIDKELLYHETRLLMKGLSESDIDGRHTIEPPYPIIPWGHIESERAFLGTAALLGLEID